MTPSFPDKKLIYANSAFAVTVGVHGLDHLRRGLMTPPIEVMVAGTLQFVAVAIMLTMVLRARPAAPKWVGLIAGIVGVLTLRARRA